MGNFRALGLFLKMNLLWLIVYLTEAMSRQEQQKERLEAFVITPHASLGVHTSSGF